MTEQTQEKETPRGWEPLLGKTIRAVRTNKSKNVIQMATRTGTIVYLTAEGECCSRSWFEHLNGLEALLGHPITRVVEREMPEDTKGDDVTRYYGWTIETPRGRCDVEMRNESNGYYGGDCVVSTEPFGDGRHEARPTILVTEDF